MTPYILTYLSVGLAFFAGLFIYRLEQRDLPKVMERAHLSPAQGWLAWTVWVLIFALLWPVAIPLTLLAMRRT